MILDEDAIFRTITENRRVNIQRLFFTLLIGFIAGLSIGYFLVTTSDSNYQYIQYRKLILTENYDLIFAETNLIEHQHKEENTTMADMLYNQVKVLCWVTTKFENHKIEGHYIKETWGKRCNKLLFFSTEDDEELGAITLKLDSKYEDENWAKTIFVLKYIYENYINEYDWFLRANEDSYMVMENLRYMLSPHDSNVPIYFGSKQEYLETVYMASTAGYVLSNSAIHRFYELFETTSSPDNCNLDGYGQEDIELAKCLQSVGVIAGDSRDNESRITFHSLGIEKHFYSLDNELKDEFFNKSYYRTGVGIDYSSDYAVSFKTVSPASMFALEYLIYHLRAYGIWSLPVDLLTEKFTIDDELQILQEHEKDRARID